MRERIAIVGSGISGLGCLRFLAQHHEITLFDRDLRPGGHAHTIDVTEPGTGQALPMDTGFMVFNEVTYPHLCRLFKELGVVSKPTAMSFAVRHDPSSLEWCGSSVRHLFAQKRNLWRWRFWRLLWKINRFNQLATQTWNTPEAENLTLAAWCQKHQLDQDFLDLYLLPMSAAVWSTPPELMLQFPAAALLRFFYNHGFLGLHTQHPWLTLQGGSRTYVQALLKKFPVQLRLGVGVQKVYRENAQVKVVTAQGTETFDRVILASHADTSLALLADADSAEQQVLSCFKYNKNLAIVHTDTSPLPRIESARSSWNYRIWEDAQGRQTSTHYWMNSLQGLTQRGDFIVTINHPEQVQSEKILQTIPTEHPLFDLGALQAQHRVTEVNHRHAQRVHFVGAWQRYGFHEDGLWSAHRLCSHLLGRDAWEA